MPKRFLVFAGLACLLFAISGAGASVDHSQVAKTDDGRSWYISEVNMEEKVAPRGALGVGEAITVNYKGRFTGFAREIPLSSDQQLSNFYVADLEKDYKPGASAEIGSAGEPGTWGGRQVSPSMYRIVWHHDTTDASRTFVSDYSVSRATERFPDGDVVRIRVWGDQWKSSVNKLAFRLILPTAAKAKLSAGPAWLKPRFGQSGKNVWLKAQGIPAFQSLDLLVALPRGSLGPGVPVKPGPLPSIDKSAASRVYMSFAHSPLPRFILWFFGLAILGFGAAAAWLLFWKRRCRDADFNSEGLTYDPPPGQSLVFGFAASEEKSPNRGRAVVATLIDLVARGFYKRENVRDPYGDWRLQIALPESRDQSAAVSPGEAAVINYFDQLLLAGPCVVDDLDSRVSPTKEDHERYEQMEYALQAEANSAQAAQKPRGWVAKPPAIIWIALVSVVIYWLTTPVGIPSGALLGILAMIVFSTLAVVTWPRSDFVKSDEQAMLYAGPWRGWRDFILTFSSMQTAPDLQVELWERAFAGALLFGVAREFTERAKVLVPSLPDDTTALAGTATYSSSLGSSLSSSSSPPSSSSGGFGGGGGFDGGGSGGGGGDSW